MYLTIVRYVAGSPVSRGELKLTLRSGLPGFLASNHRKMIKDDDLQIIQETLTILKIVNLCDWYPEPNIESITKSGTIDIMSSGYNSLLDHTKLVINQLNIKIERNDVLFRGLHQTNKSGLCGPAEYSSVRELELSALENFMALYSIGGQRFHKKWSDVRELTSLLTPDQLIGSSRPKSRWDQKSLGKLSLVKDPAGKLRVIAIYDYWTQTVLKPLHMKIIKSLGIWFEGTDTTMDQRGFNPSDFRGPFFCYDLKSATDRLPVLYQYHIISILLGEEYANNWKHLMVDRQFQLSWDPKKTVRYSVGQPMGAYSSWAMLALSHHLVVRVCAYRVTGTPVFTKYLILGDDIVIMDPKVAREYRRLMTSILGVEISESKSLESLHTFEFAKRIFKNGKEISPLTIWQLFMVTEPLTVLVNFLLETSRRRLGG